MLNLLYGSLLGDASIMRFNIKGPNKNYYAYRFEIAHNKQQKNYLMWKAQYLGLDSTRVHKRTSGYGSQMFYFRIGTAAMKSIYDTCVVNSKKTVTTEWLKHLDALSLAVWYQDDGSWGRCGTKNIQGVYSQRYSTLSTYGFDLKSIDRLCDWLRTFGLKPKIKKHKKKYWGIVLGHTSTIKLWNIVAPYLTLQHKIDFTMRNQWVKCRYCNKFIDYRNKIRICDWCIVGDPVTAQQISWSALYQRFGITTINKLSTIKLKRYSEPKLHWFDHSKFGALVQQGYH